MEIITAIVTLGALGLLFGVGLALASKRLAVQVDPRLEKIHGLLPGANCGACGGAGCFGFAEDVLSGRLSVDACRVAEHGAKEQIADILGKAISAKTKLTAALHCYGGAKVSDRFLYKGIQTCAAAHMLLGGQKACAYGCVGFGDCVRVCPFDALRMTLEGLPEVALDKCRACNKCVLVCPKKLFSLIPATHKVFVACRSFDIGKNTRAACPVGCIACRKCEQICPEDAIVVVENLAVIDYNKCTSCGKCVVVCPMKTIRER